MSELPQADELPRTEDGYDPARVEQAFSEFSERVRGLESIASELRSELQALRAERSTPARFAGETWPSDPQPGSAAFAPDWIAAVPPPVGRRPSVPRVALEGAFLLIVALLAGLADLTAVWIVLVMAAAWALVVLSEWAAAAKRARWRLDEVAPPVATPGEAASDSTGPWDAPVVEATVIEDAVEAESKTIVTKLPTDADGPASADEEVEPAPRHRFRPWRRRSAEASAADPWEA